MASTWNNEVEVLIPTEYKNSVWKKIFDKYDSNHDGKISYHEFETLLFEIVRNEYVSNKILSQIRQKNYSHEIDYLEYLGYIVMIEKKDMNVQVIDGFVELYIHESSPDEKSIVPPALKFILTNKQEYSHYLSALLMIVLSIIEIVILIHDTFESQTQTGIAQWLIHRPFRKAEFWRFSTYIFVNVGLLQLILNIFIQLMIGTFAIAHKWQRILIVFFAGVLAGSFSTSIFDPDKCLAGASSGLYALITAFAADIISQWRQKKVCSLQIFIFSLIIVLDFGLAVVRPAKYIHNCYGFDKNNRVSCIGHIAGATTGILVGIDVLGNIEKESWKDLACTSGVLIYTIFMMIAMLYNAHDIFPKHAFSQ